MVTASSNLGQSVRPAGPPGLYVREMPARAEDAHALASGVPAFVGFAQPATAASGSSARVQSTVIEHWDAREFGRAVGQASHHMRMAVRGFFANGGKRCVVMTAGPRAGGVDGRARLLEVLQRGGPLEDREDVDLICVPDTASMLDDHVRHEVQAAALAHCEAMGDRFAILDAPDTRSSTAPDAVQSMLRLASSLKSPFGAMYFPWIAPGPTHDGPALAELRVGSGQWRCGHRVDRGAEPASTSFIPPCGHVAGIFARVDRLAGPQRAPANELLEGVVDTSLHLTPHQHAQLNEGGVNFLRSLHGRGIEVGGARTLNAHSPLAYVSTVRVILGFRHWLAVGMRDFVFEPQAPEMWDRIRIRLIARCLELQAAGALASADPAQAFFVKCDGETNTPDEQERGRVIAHVGLAPSVPAEFIVVRVVRDASGVTFSGLS